MRDWKTYDDIKNIQWVKNEKLSDYDAECYESEDKILALIGNNLIEGRFWKEIYKETEEIWFEFGFEGSYGDVSLDESKHILWHKLCPIQDLIA